jgi:hypothetical protein
MKMCLGIAILFGKTKINNIDLITTLSNAHQEVVRLDITVNEIFRMDIFDAGYLWRNKKGEEVKSVSRMLDRFLARVDDDVMKKRIPTDLQVAARSLGKIVAGKNWINPPMN